MIFRKNQIIRNEIFDQNAILNQNCTFLSKFWVEIVLFKIELRVEIVIL